jgi:hypothetical protein
LVTIGIAVNTLAAQLNAALEQRLLEELFENWLAGRIQQTNLSLL